MDARQVCQSRGNVGSLNLSFFLGRIVWRGEAGTRGGGLSRSFQTAVFVCCFPFSMIRGTFIKNEAK